MFAAKIEISIMSQFLTAYRLSFQQLLFQLFHKVLHRTLDVTDRQRRAVLHLLCNKRQIHALPQCHQLRIILLGRVFNPGVRRSLHRPENYTHTFFFRDLNSFSYSHVSLINDAKVRIKNYVAKEKRCLGIVFLRKVIKY